MTTTDAPAAAPEPGDPSRDDPITVQAVARLAGRPPLAPVTSFIPTGFSRRLLAVLELALESGSWRVVAARPGDGKSTTLDEFLRRHPATWIEEEASTRVRQVPVLAARVSTGLQSPDRLMYAIAAGLGAVPSSLRAYQFRSWLVEAMVRAGVAMIVIDDAHELTLAQLSYLRELTDQLASRARPVALILLAAARGADYRGGQPWRLIAGDSLVAEQFRRRLSCDAPGLSVAGLSRDEVRDVLKEMEAQYRASGAFPGLRLARWSTSMFAWLTDARLLPGADPRVRMKHLSGVVRAALEVAWAQGRDRLESDGLDLHRAAMRLVIGGADFAVFDAALGPEAPETAA